MDGAEPVIGSMQHGFPHGYFPLTTTVLESNGLVPNFD